MSSLFKKSRHPYVSFFYFAVIVCLCFAVKNPVFIASSFFCAFLMNVFLKNYRGIKNIALLMPFFILLSCLNPLVSRWGTTVIFYLFGDESKPFTLEAVCYGLNTAFMLLTVVLWFLAFSAVVTSDRLTFIFGKVFPAVSLMLVMILRMIPFYRRRLHDITLGRQGLGLSEGSSTFSKIREKIHVLNAVTSSTLEDGKLTADSMEDRYWGQKKRTAFISYKFGADDLVLFLSGVCLTAVSLIAIVKGGGKMNFYPVIDIGTFRGNLWNELAFSSNTALMFICALFCRK